jgi:hypothetical protein
VPARRLAAAAALAVTALAALAAQPASADGICAGTVEDGVVCVYPENAPTVQQGDPLLTRCVVVPARPGCTTVSVPGYGVGGGGGPLAGCEGRCVPPVAVDACDVWHVLFTSTCPR